MVNLKHLVFKHSIMMTTITTKIVEELINSGFNKKSIKIEDGSIHFSKNRFNYSITIEGEDDIIYSIDSIDGTNYSSDFFADRSEYGNLDYLEDFINQINEGNFKIYETAWKALDKYESLFEDTNVDFDEILREKYDLY
jgi:hypothetical protein